MDRHQIEGIGLTADRVADEHEQQQEAIASERAQAAALLDAIVVRIKRALPALSSNVTRSYRSHRDTSCEVHDSAESFIWRGVRVWGTGVEEHGRGQDHRGIVEGGGIWLDSKGAWHLVTYSGTWSCWQGEGDCWEADDREITTADVVEHASVEDIVSAISDALNAHVGRRVRSTDKAIRTASRLMALRELF